MLTTLSQLTVYYAGSAVGDALASGSYGHPWTWISLVQVVCFVVITAGGATTWYGRHRRHLEINNNTGSDARTSTVDTGEVAGTGATLAGASTDPEAGTGNAGTVNLKLDSHVRVSDVLPSDSCL